MTSRRIALVILITTLLGLTADAQRRNRPRSSKAARVKAKEIGSRGVVMDEMLSVLRSRPSLYAEPIQRMRRGRVVRILGISEADGVRFFRVSAPPNNTGWVQADAIFGKFREGDDVRLARLVQASRGFEQIELASAFLDLFPQSPFRPAILLLYGDLVEEAAAKLSKDAASRLDRREMAASAGPMHSYYLNFNMLDRYRRLGIIFLFNPSTRLYHYEGSSWRELAAKFPGSSEASEAQNRVESLAMKMGRTPATSP
ncbi:MAG: hypothetical protein AB7F88_04885 [Pyrinomonadaceae bacterium]